MSDIRQKIEDSWERIVGLESRNKLLEAVLEAAEKVDEYFTPNEIAEWNGDAQDDFRKFRVTIFAARRGNEPRT